MSACNDLSKPCSVCEAPGLAILPVRYSVARTRLSEQGKQSPELTAPFEVPNIPLPDSARYGLRLLRTGYLYTYMEWSDQWMCHAVSDDGFLAKISITQTPPDLSGVKACTRMANSQGGRYLVIDDLRDPASLGKLWLTFSPVHWTMDVFHRFKSDQAFREQNMRPLDLSAWCSSTAEETADQPYIARAEKALPLVAECALRTEPLADLPAPEKRKNPRPEAYSHSLHDWIGFNEQQVSNLEISMGRACVQGKVDEGMPTPQPLVIALDDAAALTADLNQLILEEQMIWSEEPQRKPQFASASGISMLKRLVHINAPRDEWLMRKLGASSYEVMMGDVPYGLRPSLEELGLSDEDIAITPEEAEKLGKEAWETRYRKWLLNQDDQAPVKYLELYRNEMVLFEEAIIAPLDASYVAWLDSPDLKRQMKANFGQDSVYAWAAYTGEIINILENSTARNLTNEYLKKCLAQGQDSVSSIVVRAMMFNSQILLDKWQQSSKEASDVYSSESGLPWNATASKLITAYAGLVDPKTGGMLFSLASKLLYVLGRPMLEFLGSQQQRTQSIATRLSFGWMAFVARLDNPNMKIVPLQWSGDIFELRNGMARVIGGTQSTSKAIAGSILRKTGKQIRRAPVDVEFFMVFDETELSKLRENLPVDKEVRNKKFANAIQFKNYDELFKEGILQPRASQVALNSVGSFLSVLNVVAQHGEYTKVADSKKIKASANITEAYVSLVGVVTETWAVALANTKYFSSVASSSVMRKLFGSSVSRSQILASCGRWLTGVGAIVGGVLTVSEGWDGGKYNQLYGGVTILAGVMITIAGLMLFTALAAFSVPLLVFAALLVFAVSWIKPDDIERWLAKVLFFGKGASDGTQWFSSVKEQQEELESLLRG